MAEPTSPVPATAPAPPGPTNESSDMVEIAMMLFALAPVAGAVASAPMVGLSLVTLGLLDTVLILARG